LLHPPELQLPLFLHPRGVPPPLLQFEQLIILLICVKIQKINPNSAGDFEQQSQFPIKLLSFNKI
jgi:hypothetical protein